MRLGAAGGVGARHGRVRARVGPRSRAARPTWNVSNPVSIVIHVTDISPLPARSKSSMDISMEMSRAPQSSQSVPSAQRRCTSVSSPGPPSEHAGVTVVRRGARVFAHADMDRRVLQHVAGQDVAHAEVRGANGQVGVGVEYAHCPSTPASRRQRERGAVHHGSSPSNERRRCTVPHSSSRSCRSPGDGERERPRRPEDDFRAEDDGRGAP